MKCVIICMVCFELTFACSVSENTAGTSSEDVIIKEGNSLIINCTLFDTIIEREGLLYNVDSTQLKFKNETSKKLIAYDKITYPDQYTAQVIIPNTSLSDTGYYHCFLNYDEAKTNEFVCSTHVQIQVPPKAVKNISCTSNNLQELTCHWDVDHQSDVTYELRLESATFRGLSHKCKNVKYNSCVWNKANEGLFHFPSETYIIYLTGRNDLGNLTQIYSFNQYENLIPSKPKQFSKILPSTNTLSLAWFPPEGMEADIYEDSLEYEIQYYPKDFPELKTTIYTNKTFHVIEDLKPFTNYTIEIRCKSKETPQIRKYWSNCLSTTNQTTADVPYEIPEFNPQGFRSIIANYRRKVFLNWKNLPKTEQNGPNFGYTVEVYPQVTPQLQIFDPMTRVVTEPCVTYESLRQNIAYSFRIYSSNSMGKSEKYIEFFVDKEENLPLSPSNLMLFFINSSTNHITWTDVYSDAVLTLFWGWKSVQCPSTFEWKKIDSSSPMVFSNASELYWFAMSTEHEGKVSGMNLIECYWHEDAKLTFNNLEIRLKPTSIEIVWTITCNFATRGFFFDICESNGKYICLEERPIVYSTTQNATSIEIPDLKPYTKYRVRIGYQTHLEKRKWTESREVTTQPSAPDQPENFNLLSVTYNSIHVSWTPPIHMNGPFYAYKLYYGRNSVTNMIPEINDYVLTRGITAFTNHTIYLKACVLDRSLCTPGALCLPICSSAAYLKVETPRGVPGPIKFVQVQETNGSFVLVTWDAPEDPEGPIDLYIITMQGNTVYSEGPEHKIVYEVACEPNLDEISFNFTIRAVNIENGTYLEGPNTTRKFYRLCPHPFLSPKIIICIIVITCVLIIPISIAIIYKIVKCYKKANKIKGLTLQLPDALDNRIFFRVSDKIENKLDKEENPNVEDDLPKTETKGSVSTVSTERSVISVSSDEEVDNVFCIASTEECPLECLRESMTIPEREDSIEIERVNIPVDNLDVEIQKSICIISTSSTVYNVPSYVMINELGMPMVPTRTAYIQPNQLLSCDIFLTPENTKIDICT